MGRTKKTLPKKTSQKTSEEVSASSSSSTETIDSSGEKEPVQPVQVERVETLPPPLMSSRDNHRYRNLVLSNGVKILLISSCQAIKESMIMSGKKVEEKVDCETESRKPDSSIFNRNRRADMKKKKAEAEEAEAKGKKNSGECGPEGKDGEEQDIGMIGSVIDTLKNWTAGSNSGTGSDPDAGWGLPEPNPAAIDEEHEKATCQAIGKESGFAEIAMNVACGSVDDSADAQGIAEVVLGAIAHWMDQTMQGLSIFEHQVRADDSNIAFLVSLNNFDSLLKEFGRTLRKFDAKTKSKDLEDVLEFMDYNQEMEQCGLNWKSSHFERRRLALLASLAVSGNRVQNVIKHGNPARLWELVENVDEKSKTSELAILVSKYFEKHYVGCQMSFTIEAPRTLDRLQEIVVDAFSEFQPGEKPSESSDDSGSPFGSEDFKMFYTLKCSHQKCSISDQGRPGEFVVVTWALPAKFWKDCEVKPLEYLTALFSDERRGGLCHYLRQMNWAISLEAGCPQFWDERGSSGLHRNQFCSLFEVKVWLREGGVEAVDKVIEAVYSYVRFVKDSGPQKPFYLELRNLRFLDFNGHAQDGDGQRGNFRWRRVNLASTSSNSLRYHEPSTVLVAPYLLHHFDENVIQEAVDHFTPESANYMYCLNAQAEETDATEPILQTKYSVESVSGERLTSWQSVVAYPEFQLFEPNRFISSNSCIIPPTETGDIILYDPEGEGPCNYRVWYQHDSRMNIYSMYSVHFASQMISSSPDAFESAMLIVWARMLQEILAPIQYEMRAAGIESKLKVTKFGIVLCLFSWNKKIRDAVKSVIDESFLTFEKVASNEIFERAKKDMIDHLVYSAGTWTSNYFQKIVPDDLYETLTEVNHAPIPELIEQIMDEHFTLERLMEFVQMFRKNVSICALIRGNVNEETAEEFSRMIEENFKPKTLAIVKRVRQREIQHGENIMRVQSTDPDSMIDTVDNYYQIGRSNTMTRLLADFAICAIRNGYKEKSGQKERMRVQPRLVERRGILTVVVDYHDPSFDSKKPRSLNEMNKYVQDGMDQIYRLILDKMTSKEFNECRQQLKPTSEPDLGCSENWEAYYDPMNLNQYIEDLTFRFDERACRLEAWKSVTLEDVKEFWLKHFCKESQHYRKISVQIIRSQDLPKEQAVTIDETEKEHHNRRRKFRNCFYSWFDLLTVTPAKDASKIKYEFHSEDKKCDPKFILDPQVHANKLYKFPVAVDMD